MNPLSIHDGSRSGHRHNWRRTRHPTLEQRQAEAAAAQKRRDHFAAQAATVNQPIQTKNEHNQTT